jgi:hypothetical protein
MNNSPLAEPDVGSVTGDSEDAILTKVELSELASIWNVTVSVPEAAEAAE